MVNREVKTVGASNTLDELRSIIAAKLWKSDFSEFRHTGDFNGPSFLPGVEFFVSDKSFDLKLSVRDAANFGNKCRLDYTDKENGASTHVEYGEFSQGGRMVGSLLSTFREVAEKRLESKANSYMMDIEDLVARIPGSAWTRSSDLDRRYTSSRCRYGSHLSAKYGDVEIQLSRLELEGNDHRWNLIAEVSVAHQAEESQVGSSATNKGRAFEATVSAEEQTSKGRLGELFRKIIESNPELKEEDDLRSAIPSILSSIPRQDWNTIKQRRYSWDVDYTEFVTSAETEQYTVRFVQKFFEPAHHWNSMRISILDKHRNLEIEVGGGEATKLYTNLEDYHFQQLQMAKESARQKTPGELLYAEAEKVIIAANHRDWSMDQQGYQYIDITKQLADPARYGIKEGHRIVICAGKSSVSIYDIPPNKEPRSCLYSKSDKGAKPILTTAWNCFEQSKQLLMEGIEHIEKDPSGWIRTLPESGVTAQQDYNRWQSIQCRNGDFTISIVREPLPRVTGIVLYYDTITLSGVIGAAAYSAKLDVSSHRGVLKAVFECFPDSVQELDEEPGRRLAGLARNPGEHGLDAFHKGNSDSLSGSQILRSLVGLGKSVARGLWGQREG